MFEIKNFLEFNFYNNFSLSIIDRSLFDEKNLVNFKNNKFVITSDQQVYKNIIKESYILNKVLDLVMYGEIFKNIYYEGKKIIFKLSFFF